MKMYKKSLLGLMVLSAMSLMAAEDKVIYVNTFEDENGENLNNCSLREAITAAHLNKAYGGCSAGNTALGQPDIIQLEAGEYKLKRGELSPQSAVQIYGKTPLDYSAKDPLTHQYPALKPVQTQISGNHSSRIFNTLETQASLSLNNIELKDGYTSSNGGAVLVAAPLTMTNTVIRNSRAEKAGGAIYLVAQNSEKTVSLLNTLIQGNQAQMGSVLAMDCAANLSDTKPVISIERSSIVENGSVDSSSAIDLCGLASVALTANTIAKNIASPLNGHIIKAVDEPGRTLSPYFALQAVSNTIVENSAKSTFYYDENGSKVLYLNVLAFNQGKSCHYRLSNSQSESKNLGLILSKNALQLGNVEQGQCEVPEEALKDETADMASVDLTPVSRQTVLSDYQQPSAYNLYLPLYYPKDNKSATDLVDVGLTDCSKKDQRGLERVTDATLILNPELTNTCDIGSVELMRLTAADIIDLKNQSQVQLLEDYQASYDQLKSIIANTPKEDERLNAYQERLKEFEDLMTYTKAKQHYRTIYVDPFTLALPDEEEVPNSKGALQTRELDAEHYQVTTHKYGVGSVTGSGESFTFTGQADENLVCEWDPQLKRIMIYRTDDQLSTTTGSAYCSYTLTGSGGKSSTGLMKADFVNIAPIAKNITYPLNYGSDFKVSINPLEHANDDGDGPVSTLKVNHDKPAFYHDKEGNELPIRLSEIPAGVIVTADRSGPCPNSYVRDKCYGGKLYIQVKNNFSQFDYAFKYNVFDAEGLESNDAQLVLVNTAKNTNTSGGGGSLGFWSIAGLLGLGLYRFRRKK